MGKEMKKAEAKHKHEHNHAVQRRMKGAALESPQGGRITQLEVMANDSPVSVAQRRVISSITNSPRMSVQRMKASIQPASPIQLAPGSGVGRDGDDERLGPDKGEQASQTPRPELDVLPSATATVSSSEIKDGYSPRNGGGRYDDTEL